MGCAGASAVRCAGAGARLAVMQNDEFSAWDNLKFTLLPIIAVGLVIGGLGYLVLLFF